MADRSHHARCSHRSAERCRLVGCAEAVNRIELQFLGSGDAFGSGDRFQTCLLLRGAGAGLLVDCGASSLIALKRARVDPAAIGAVVVTHLHGDHFGGLPFLILDGQFSGRTAPLTIAGLLTHMSADMCRGSRRWMRNAPRTGLTLAL